MQSRPNARRVEKREPNRLSGEYPVEDENFWPGNCSDQRRCACSRKDDNVEYDGQWVLPVRQPFFRFLLMLPAVFLVILVMALVQVHSDSDYHERQNGRFTEPLYDIGHCMLPNMNTDTHKLIAEIPLFALLGLTAVVSFTVDSKDRTRLIRRYALLQMCLYMLRTLSLLGTRLPPSDPTCNPRPVEGVTFVVSALRIVALLDSACTDMMFSGHTTSATSMLAVWVHNPRVPKLIKAIGIANLALCGFGFVSSRLHYTVDVVVAFIISVLLVLCYNSGWQLIKLRYPVPRPSTPLIAKIIYWIEGDDLRIADNYSQPLRIPTSDNQRSNKLA